MWWLDIQLQDTLTRIHRYGRLLGLQHHKPEERKERHKEKREARHEARMERKEERRSGNGQ